MTGAATMAVAALAAAADQQAAGSAGNAIEGPSEGGERGDNARTHPFLALFLGCGSGLPLLPGQPVRLIAPSRVKRQ